MTAALSCALLSLCLGTPAGAAILFSESFDTDVADETAFNTQYPAFTTNVGGGGTLSVSSGVLTFDGQATTTATVPGFDDDIIITGDIGAVNSNGSYNVGLQVGGTRYVFHPGLGGGAFRIESGQSNTNMGFTPANGTLHQMQIIQFHDTGLMEITVTDGNNPANVFTASISKPGDVGGAIGFRRSGSTAFAGLFDNLEIKHAPFMVGNNGQPLTIATDSFIAATATDAIELQNTGVANSGLDILSFSLSGPDAAAFDVPDFAPVELFAGVNTTELFDLSFNPGGEFGEFFATLTFNTNVGTIDFQLVGAAVPEPASGMMLAGGCVMLLMRQRRRARATTRSA